jgi:hypothetical protein
MYDVMNNTHSSFIQIKYDNPESSFARSYGAVEVIEVTSNFESWKAN